MDYLDVAALWQDARNVKLTQNDLFVFVILVIIIVVIVIILIVVIIVIVEKVAIFLGAFGHFLFFLIVIGDAIEGNGMSLGNFKLRFAFGAAKNFAFFDFVLVDVDFSGTFRAAD